MTENSALGPWPACPTGFAFASSIAQKGGHVIIASRSVQTMQRAVDKIKVLPGPQEVALQHLLICCFLRHRRRGICIGYVNGRVSFLCITV